VADFVVGNKIDTAEAEAVGRVIANIEGSNPRARIVRAASPVVLEDGPSLVGSRVLVVDDGPTLTRGGMPFGAGTVAARQGGALELADPRPFAVGSIADVLERYPHLHSLPAMGYSPDQLAELEATINASGCDVVVSGTPIDLGRLIDSKIPIRHARYELREIGEPTLADVLAPLGARVAAVPALI
jgi:predicted GTPase